MLKTFLAQMSKTLQVLTSWYSNDLNVERKRLRGASLLGLSEHLGGGDSVAIIF